jgi:hypothetical protein
VGVLGSVRLARPRSRWAQRRYAAGSRKAAAAARRDARVRAVQTRLLNLIAGTPSGEDVNVNRR